MGCLINALLMMVMLALAENYPALGPLFLLAGIAFLVRGYAAMDAPKARASSQETSMPTLPAHLLAVRGDLHPILVRLYCALHGEGHQEAGAVDAIILLAEYRSTLKTLFDALVRINREIFVPSSCEPATRQSASALVALSATALTQRYGQVRVALFQHPKDQRLLRLEHNQRANLERLAMWLADIQLALQDPKRLKPDGKGNWRNLYELHFSYLDNLADLESWVADPTGYDSGHVSAALEGVLSHRRGMRTDLAPARPAPPAPKRRASGDWATPFVIGWIVGDWFFDDDHSS